MKQEIVKYETGATSHAVNDLILFTDNTRELAEYRDSCYKIWLDRPSYGKEIFRQLFDKAIIAYLKEFGHTNSKHISNLTSSDFTEYYLLYSLDFNNWKLEHGYK